MRAPTFGPTDHNTASLLDLLAEQHPATPSEADEWKHFVATLKRVSAGTGYVDQNAARPFLRGEVRPSRLGPFFRRACREGLIRPDGWTVSDDVVSRNRGRAQRRYRWLGTTT